MGLQYVTEFIHVLSIIHVYMQLEIIRKIKTLLSTQAGFHALIIECAAQKSFSLKKRGLIDHFISLNCRFT